LGSLAAGAGGVFYAREVETRWFELTHTEVRLKGSKLGGKKILHVSDIHMSDGMTAEDLEVGFRAGLREKPDAICLTGDFVSHLGWFDEAGLRRMLQWAAGTAPTYAVLGNHDGGKWLSDFGMESSTAKIKNLVRESGVRLLDNEAVQEGGLRLVGIGDLWSGEFHPEVAFNELPESDLPTVVLCHNPDGKDKMPGLDWDLMLCGHTHGGQGRIPGLKPIVLPVKDKSMVAGLYAWKGKQVFITRGLGSPRHVRAFCRPEVSLLHLG
jgi:uncharacterized protein